MNKLLAVALIMVGLVTGASAENDDSVRIDDTFAKARKWLSEQNLILTGTPSGRDDTAAFSQEAIVFYGEGAGNPDARTPAQRELGAKRAAVVMAQRAIAEYLGGVALVGETKVEDGMQKNDQIRSAVAAWSSSSPIPTGRGTTSTEARPMRFRQGRTGSTWRSRRRSVPR